jgi:uncharacterized membrane protein YfcA
MLVIYLLLGAVVGTMSGMLGIGGGILIIPALSTIFAYLKIMPDALIMHMAIGTSLAIVIMTSSSGLYAYHKRASVRWDIAKLIAPSLIAGVLIGVLIANSLSSHFLQIFFGIFLLILSLKFLIEKSKKEISQKPLSKKWMNAIAGLIGVLCSVLGLGGGVLLMPFLLHCQIEIRKAAGTSLACGMMVGIVATVSFMLSRSASTAMIPWSTGYIYWPAFLGISVASMLFAPVGASLAHRLPTAVLRKIFAVFLFMIAVDMLLRVKS